MSDRWFVGESMEQFIYLVFCIVVGSLAMFGVQW